MLERTLVRLALCVTLFPQRVFACIGYCQGMLSKKARRLKFHPTDAGVILSALRVCRGGNQFSGASLHSSPLSSEARCRRGGSVNDFLPEFTVWSDLFICTVNSIRRMFLLGGGGESSCGDSDIQLVVVELVMVVVCVWAFFGCCNLSVPGALLELGCGCQNIYRA